MNGIAARQGRALAFARKLRYAIGAMGTGVGRGLPTLAYALCVGLWGCAEDPNGDTAAPTLTELTETVFTPSCILGRCHVTSAPAGGLSLSGRRIRVYDALVNAPAMGVANRVRVVPGDPDASYLMEKLTSEMPSAGTPMPPMARLPDVDIERIRRWIAAGALDD